MTRTVSLTSLSAANRARCICDHETVEATPNFVKTSEPDRGRLCPRLGRSPVDAIKKAFEHVTQLARMPMSAILKKRHKSLNPAVNVRPRTNVLTLRDFCSRVILAEFPLKRKRQDIISYLLGTNRSLHGNLRNRLEMMIQIPSRHN